MVLSSRRVYFLVTLLILGAIFCFTPLISLKKHENYALIDSYLDRVVSDVNRDSPIFLISLSIVLIPFVDLVLDFITLFYGQESSLKKRVKSSGVIRLTDVERLMFVLGVAIQSTVYFLSRKTDNHTVNLVIHCVGNANALLILGPIVIFLGRCTETFSQNRTTFTIIFPVIGVAVRSVSYFYRSDSEKFSRINIAGTTFILCGAALYGYCILLCCQKYYQQKLGSRADRELWLNSIFEPHQPKSIEDADYSTGYDNELYANYVPALHIISSVVICLSTSIRGLSSSSEVNLVWVNPDYVIICAEIMVLVIELRIRKNEITRGLVRICYLFFITSNLLTSTDCFL